MQWVRYLRVKNPLRLIDDMDEIAWFPTTLRNNEEV
jgi:hypothetical protein